MPASASTKTVRNEYSVVRKATEPLTLSTRSSSDSAAPQKEVQLLPLSESTRDVEEGTRIELERFLEMMQSERACIWGECHRIAERRALEKEAQAAEEYAASPPWYSAAASLSVTTAEACLLSDAKL